MKIFDIFASALQAYCSENKLDFNKVKESPKCGNETALFIQRLGDSNKGLEESNPAEILLFAMKDENGSIFVEEYEGAAKYLHA